MYLATVSYKIMPEGKKTYVKKTEQYLIDSVNITDVEISLTKYFKDSIERNEKMDLKIVPVKKAPIHDIILEDFDSAFHTIYTGVAVNKEDKFRHNFYVSAVDGENGLEQAIEKAKKYYNGYANIDKIGTTKIILDTELCQPKTGELLNF